MSEMGLETEINDHSIKRLVDHFYGKVIEDDLLGPVFRNAIGESLDDWGDHLATMYRFWSSVMLTTGRYKGNPVKAHMELVDQVEPHFFEHWLTLWTEASEEVFVPDLAIAFQKKAKSIAQSLSFMMFERFMPDTLSARPA
ncbi:group III truncated hemoglobin [Aestuariispira ectoiniformans]|uniref:group III truncated hemoglobin n=1 Tax=Aestuariispira ectoiniformans TaxID=2775080 RepID=UPI00223AFB2E|nr:group III truncated hemoglobin [Aestuariispira ectoiniformans]